MAKVKKDEKNLAKENFEEISSLEKPIEIAPEINEVIEREEKLTGEEIQKLREKIEKTDLDDHLKTQVQSHVNDLNMSGLENEGKIEKLLEITKNKGIIYSVHIAKKMNDPYILDALHDTLAENGYYKEFLK